MDDFSVDSTFILYFPTTDLTGAVELLSIEDFLDVLGEDFPVVVFVVVEVVAVDDVSKDDDVQSFEIDGFEGSFISLSFIINPRPAVSLRIESDLLREGFEFDLTIVDVGVVVVAGRANGTAGIPLVAEGAPELPVLLLLLLLLPLNLLEGIGAGRFGISIFELSVNVETDPVESRF